MCDNLLENNMKSDLELLVEYDMYELGYDPNNKEDIVKYWKEKLDD